MLEIIGISVVVIAAMVAGLIWRGYVLSVLWTWLVVPTTHWRPITIAEALAICCIVYAIKPGQGSAKKKDQDALEKLIEAFLSIAIGPLVSLAFGYVIKQYL